MLRGLVCRVLRRRRRTPRLDIVIEVFEHGATYWSVESYNSNVTQGEAERRAWETLDYNRDKYDRARLVDEHSGRVINELMYGRGGADGHRNDSGEG